MVLVYMKWHLLGKNIRFTEEYWTLCLQYAVFELKASSMYRNLFVLNIIVFGQ